MADERHGGPVIRWMFRAWATAAAAWMKEISVGRRWYEVCNVWSRCISNSGGLV